MTFVKLVNILGDMYRNAPDKEQMTFLTIFGIQYADEILSMARSYSMSDTAFIRRLHQQAGILGKTGKPKNGIEVKQGTKLSQYVQMKQNMPNWL